MPLSTVHSNSLLYFLLFCETHYLVWEIISVSEKRMKNCVVKIIDNAFEKNDEVGLFPLTLAPLGGPKTPPPCGFSQIAPEVLGISLWNMPYLSGQQFHTLCQKIRTQVIIGQPWVTSEWRHVSPILTSKMGLRESPPRVQFYSYDQLTYMKWRRISMATKLLSRIFKIFKISENFQKRSNFFFLFETVSTNQNIQKTVTYVRGQCLMNMCTQFQADIFKNGWDIT